MNQLERVSKAKAELYANAQQIKTPAARATAAEDFTIGYLEGVSDTDNKLKAVRKYIDSLLHTAYVHQETYSYTLAKFLQEIVK